MQIAKLLHTPEKKVSHAVDHVERLKPFPGEDAVGEGYDLSVALRSNWRFATL